MRQTTRSAWMIEALAMCLPQRGGQGLSQMLYATLRGWIETGELAAGEALPSSRQLARELTIGRNTALAALDRLLSEGFLNSRTGAGLFVAEVVRYSR